MLSSYHCEPDMDVYIQATLDIAILFIVVLFSSFCCYYCLEKLLLCTAAEQIFLTLTSYIGTLCHSLPFPQDNCRK